MLHNCLYNKIKLLHDLSSASWFIKNHALADAQKGGHDECNNELNELQADLEKHIKAIEEKVCKQCK